MRYIFRDIESYIEKHIYFITIVFIIPIDFSIDMTTTNKCLSCGHRYEEHSFIGEWCPPNYNGESIEEHEEAKNGI